MISPFSLRLTPSDTLKVVQGLRGIAVLAQLAVLFLAIQVVDIRLPTGWILAGIGLLLAAWLATFARLGRDWPVTELEIAGHLLFDVGVLTWQLYLAGGSSNPFVSAYLVPIALAAIALRALPALAVTGVCMGAYTALLKFYVPFEYAHHGATGGFSLHVFGMWVNFILSACLIAGLLRLMAENLRRRDRLINAAREEMLRNEHVVGLGALAAGAAHELSTPLSTVALLADELALELADRPQAQQDLALLKQQVQQCKASLSTLLASAGQGRLETLRPVAIDGFLRATLERWRLLRPEVALEADLDIGAAAAPLSEQGLAQVLINLLNNAADASLAAGQGRVSLAARVRAGRLMVEIEDDGAGLDQAARARAGRASFSSKPGGSGLGLLLSNTTLSRWGGSLSLHDRPAGGTLTRVELPLHRLSAQPDETLAAD